MLTQAARQAGHEAWWPAGDVARGVLQYLRERFDENIITLQDLFLRVSQTLRSIGFPEIASAVRPEPPPLEVCLLELAREAQGLELGFLPGLMRELGELRQDGYAASGAGQSAAGGDVRAGRDGVDRGLSRVGGGNRRDDPVVGGLSREAVAAGVWF